MPNQPDILLLIEKYLSGTATDEEKQLLNEWYHSFNDAEVELMTEETPQNFEERLKNKIMEAVNDLHETKTIKKYKRWYIPAAAAVILMAITTTCFLFISKPSKWQSTRNEYAQSNRATDAAPGGNRAILTLPDGSTVVLDSVSNGVINQQGGIKVQKLQNGLVAYSKNNQSSANANNVVYNTITTPRGGQYQITLSDGTKVWLNAASSIHFPIAFTGSERRVEITGEAYFEVAKNKAMPFKVKAASSEIEVLGTHFNVNAYNDESYIKTTLMEGSVKVSVSATGGGYVSKFLKPGQQASISRSQKIMISDNTDIEEVLAWKNGLFLYNGTDIHTILRQVSKWYNVDIEYKGSVNTHFTGQLKRELFASKVLEKLALTGEVHFKIEGEKVIVTP